jgi:tRNA-splicing ligase RtcB (3'-phosphate/5'-hydroxy nucleic acid ligase)
VYDLEAQLKESTSAPVGAIFYKKFCSWYTIVRGKEMVEISGSNGIAKVFNDEVESTAISQIEALMNHKISYGKKVRFMPDVHAGAGTVIGTTIEIGDCIVPNVVGVDIGCGVDAYFIGDVDIDFSVLDKAIRSLVPSGKNVHSKNVSGLSEYLKEMILDTCCNIGLEDVDRVFNSIGTLGGGNHFIEVAEDNFGDKWLLIHSGSRNFGLQVANFHQKKANAICGYKETSFLEGNDAKEYFRDMEVAQEFAVENRSSIAKIILDSLGFKIEAKVLSVHNYIDFEDGIIRKGAIRAHKEDMVVIPFNMADGSIIGLGKGNEDWNFSAPHGAGRVLSRKKAKETVSLENFKRVMDDAGVWTTSVNAGTLDESPFAYKNAESIIKYLEPTVKILYRLRPVYNFKSAD